MADRDGAAPGRVDPADPPAPAATDPLVPGRGSTLAVSRRAMTDRREASAVAGSGSGRVSPPAPEPGLWVPSGRPVRVATLPEGEHARADSMAKAGSIARIGRVEAPGTGDPPAPPARGRGRPAPAVDRNARGRSGETTASGALEAIVAGAPARRSRGGTPAGNSGPRGRGKVARPVSGRRARGRTGARPSRGRTTATHGAGETSRSRRATPGPRHGTNRARIHATSRISSARPIARSSRAGWSRMDAPNPRLPACPFGPDQGPTAARTPDAQSAPEAQRRDHAAPVSATGRTTRGARNR